VHVGSDWAVAGLPWAQSLHHLPLMSLLPLQPLLPIPALQLLAPCLASAASHSCGQWSRSKEMAPFARWCPEIDLSELLLLLLLLPAPRVV
jgi:hypothetical protein